MNLFFVKKILLHKITLQCVQHCTSKKTWLNNKNVLRVNKIDKESSKSSFHLFSLSKTNFHWKKWLGKELPVLVHFSLQSCPGILGPIMQYVLSGLRQFTDVQPDFSLFIDASSANSTLWGCSAVASMFFDSVLTSYSFKKIWLFTQHGKGGIFMKVKQREHYCEDKCGIHERAGHLPGGLTERRRRLAEMWK